MSEKTVYDKLLENWGNVKRNVKLAEVVDPLIQKGIISLDQWSDLKNANLTEKERMEDFMMNTFKKDNPEAIRIFLETLRKNGYKQIADSIDERSGKYDHYLLIFLKFILKQKKEILNALYGVS